MYIGKYPLTLQILLEVDFDKIRKEFPPDITDKIRLAYLPSHRPV